VSLPLLPAPDGASGVVIDVEVTHGTLGVDLWNEPENRWIERKAALPGRSRLSLPLRPGTGPTLILNNHQDDRTRSAAIVHRLFYVDGKQEMHADFDWRRMVIHNARDPLEDGTNPMNRQPRFACNAVYHNLYINEFFYRMPPCCYMTRVPGFDEIRFDHGVNFMDVWNAPAFVELRRRLREGPLYSACRRCPAEW
jgi:hypothetical protein